MDDDFTRFFSLVLARPAPEISFPSLNNSILYPPCVVLIDHYLRSRHFDGDLDLPNFAAPNETVAVFSGYGGHHPTSIYLSYSFLFMAYNYRDVILDILAALREQHDLRWPPTEIAFKQLGYGPIQRFLPAYLSALDTFIAGWLVTIIVNKSIKSLSGIGGIGGPRYLSKVLQDAGLGIWKPKVAEELLRCYLCALIVPDGSKVFWMTDHDAIVSNMTKANQTANLLLSLLGEYTCKQITFVGYATPFVDQNDTLHRDLLSASDLAAGAFSEYCSSLRRLGQSAQRAQPVYEWLARQGSGLRKTTMMIEPADDKHLKITGLNGGKPT